jgi:hypothetical protein
MKLAAGELVVLVVFWLVVASAVAPQEDLMVAITTAGGRGLVVVVVVMMAGELVHADPVQILFQLLMAVVVRYSEASENEIRVKNVIREISRCAQAALVGLARRHGPAYRWLSQPPKSFVFGLSHG